LSVTQQPATRNGRRSHRPPLALAYHALADDWDDPLAVSPGRFEAHMRRLHAAGYEGIRFSELALGPRRDGVVAVTFDDAFASVRAHALPLLEGLGWPATVFASASVIDDGVPMTWLLGEHGRTPGRDGILDPLDWEGLRQLHSRGWEIGSHGATHRRLSALEPDERRRELDLSRERIESEVGECTAISYPWGEVVDGVVDAAVGAGYTAGGGLEGRFCSERDPMRVPRFAVSRRDGSFRFAAKTSRMLASVRRTAVWSGLEVIRRRDYEPEDDVQRRADALRG
jgi:hypothetical protein